MKILILGVTGLIGNNLFNFLSKIDHLNVVGTSRNKTINNPKIFYFEYGTSSVRDLIKKIQPDCVINALGITKHVKESENIPKVILVNSHFPHELAQACHELRARLIHISTDCVFSGLKGDYSEFDIPDAKDLYGRSKLLGEVTYGSNLTLRISTIGHELSTQNGLLEWFLDRQHSCCGFTKAIFSGLPVLYFASVLNQYILNNPNISGLYHIASQPITKYDLLNKLAILYNKSIDILPNDSVNINRSLNSTRFSQLTGYQLPCWSELIDKRWLEGSNV